YSVFQRLASLESGILRGRDLDLLTGARIAPGARRALAYFEGAEAGNRHAVAAAQRTADGVEHGIHSAGRVGAGQAGPAGDGFDDVTLLGHIFGNSCATRVALVSTGRPPIEAERH